MKYMCIFVAVLTVVAAQEFDFDHDITGDRYPEWYVRGLEQFEQPRHRRDLTVDRKIGDGRGRVFGTLGQNDNGLFGKAGYDRNIFNDHRGKLDAQAYGSRVLGPAGDSSHYGGALNWQNKNAAASLDISRQIHGPSSINAAAGGRWPVGKNGDFSAQGFYDQTGGMRDYGGRAVYNHRW